MRAHLWTALPLAVAAILGAGAATLALEGTASATPVELKITTTAVPAPVAAIPFEDLLKASATIDVVDAPGGQVDLYLLSSNAEQRSKTACKLPVGPGRRVELNPTSAAAADAAAGNASCRNLLPGKEPLRLGVSAPGSSAFGVVAFEPPAPYSGGPATIVIQRGAGPAAPIAWPWKIPANVKLAGNTCWLFARSWASLPCARNEITPDDRTKALAEAAVMSGGGSGQVASIALVAQVIDASSGTAGAWRTLPIELKEPPLPTVAEPQELDLNRSCEAQVAAEVKKGLAPEGAFYVICADVRKPMTAFVTTWLKPESGPLERADDHRMNVNHPVVVYVWHASQNNPGIELVGQEGFPSSTYAPPGGPFKIQEHIGPPEKQIPGVETAQARKQFGARKGPTAVLTLTVKSGNEPVVITRTYTIENAYRTALRLGIGVSWSPWAKEIGIRTAGDNRRYATVTDGDGALPGLVNMELVVGYSIFAKPVRENHADDTVAFNLGLGVLRAGGTVEALSSLRLGIEWAHGLDFSLALAFGLHRHDVPKEDFRPGLALPQSATTIEKTFGVTPGLGLVLNLTPSFLKAAGIVAGGGGGSS